MASYGDDSDHVMRGCLTLQESQYLKKLFQDGLMQIIPVKDIISDTMLTQLKSFLNKLKKEMRRRTAKLWLNYLEVVEILQ